MPETPNYKDFCREVYLQTYESTYPIELRDGVSAAAQQAACLSAQRKAIDRALVEGLLHFSPDKMCGFPHAWKCPRHSCGFRIPRRS